MMRKQQIKEPGEVTKLPLAALVRGEDGRGPGKVDVSDLVESFRHGPLLNPVIVEPLGGGRFGILAGHRRYEAARVVRWTEIPVRIMRPRDDRERAMIRLEENLRRKGLPNEPEALAELHRLYTGRPYGRPPMGGNPSKEARENARSVARLAKMTGQSTNSVALKIRIAEAQPAIRNAYRDKKLNVNEAALLASLPLEKQKQATETLLEQKVLVGGRQQEAKAVLRKILRTLNARVFVLEGAIEVVQKYLAAKAARRDPGQTDAQLARFLAKTLTTRSARNLEETT